MTPVNMVTSICFPVMPLYNTLSPIDDNPNLVSRISLICSTLTVSKGVNTP